MAAPIGTEWGSRVGEYGRIGLYVKLTEDETKTKIKREVQIWFWSRFSVSDTSNTLYYTTGQNITRASTNRGSVSISTTSDSGGWSTTNQKKLKTYTTTYNKGTSNVTYKVYAKLTGVDRVGGTMYVNTSYTIPALDSYVVEYYGNGGTGVPPNQTKYYNQDLTLSTIKPERDGWEFCGWDTSNNVKTAQYKSGGTYTRNEACKLYAIWKKDITLTHDPTNGNPSSHETVTIYNKEDGYVFTTLTAPAKKGYTFVGWNTSKTATTYQYKDGVQIKIDNSTTLYAIWSENKLIVKYYSNYADYGTFRGETLNVGADKNILVHTQEFLYTTKYDNGLSDVQNRTYLYLSRTGYTSTGYWGTSPNGGTLVNQSTSYSTGQNLAKALGVSLESRSVEINVYAQWEINTFIVTYNGNGGSPVPEAQTKTYGRNLKLSTVVPKLLGYKFLGWSTHEDDKIGRYQPGDTFSLNEAVTLYAVWEQQGIAHININGSWKKGKVWINVDGTWKSGLIYQNVNGVWKQGGA